MNAFDNAANEENPILDKALEELKLEKGINSIGISKLSKGFYLAKVIGENGAVESSTKLVFSK